MLTGEAVYQLNHLLMLLNTIEDDDNIIISEVNRENRTHCEVYLPWQAVARFGICLPVAVSLHLISFLSLQGKSPPLLLFFLLSLRSLFLEAQGSLPTVSCQDKEHPGSDD